MALFNKENDLHNTFNVLEGTHKVLKTIAWKHLTLVVILKSLSWRYITQITVTLVPLFQASAVHLE